MEQGLNLATAAFKYVVSFAGSGRGLLATAPFFLLASSFFTILANALVLMAIAVSALRKALMADATSEGTITLVRANMVEHVAKLGEALAAGVALEHLVEARGRIIERLDLREAFRLADDIAPGLFFLCLSAKSLRANGCTIGIARLRFCRAQVSIINFIRPFVGKHITAFTFFVIAVNLGVTAVGNVDLRGRLNRRLVAVIF